MGKLSSKDILLNLLKCLVVFYSMYYVVGSIVFATYRLQIFDGKIPFDFQTWVDLSNCCQSDGNSSSKQLVNLISMETAFAASGLIYGAIVTHWVWDYALTVTVIHIGICCLVMLNFPMSWSWWVCLACGLTLMIGLGESISFVRRKRSKRRIIKPEETALGGEPKTYLYRKT